MSIPSSRVGVAERTFGSQGFGAGSAKRSCNRSRSSRSMSAVCSAATMRRMAVSRYSRPNHVGGSEATVRYSSCIPRSRHGTPDQRSASCSGTTSFACLPHMTATRAVA